MIKGTKFEIHTTITFYGSRQENTYSCHDNEGNVFDIIPKFNNYIFVGKRLRPKSPQDIVMNKKYEMGFNIYPYRIVRFIKTKWTESECFAIVENILDCIKKHQKFSWMSSMDKLESQEKKEDIRSPSTIHISNILTYTCVEKTNHGITRLYNSIHICVVKLSSI